MIDTKQMNGLYTILKKTYKILDVNNPLPLHKRAFACQLTHETGMNFEDAFKFFAWYTHQKKYLMALKAGAQLYDLYGRPLGGAFVKPAQELKARDYLKNTPVKEELIKAGFVKVEKKSN